VALLPSLNFDSLWATLLRLEMTFRSLLFEKWLWLAVLRRLPVFGTRDLRKNENEKN